MEEGKHEQCKLTGLPIPASCLPSLAAYLPPVPSPRAVWSPHLSHGSPSYLLLSSQFMGFFSKCFDSNWENKLLVPSLSPGPDSQNKPGVEENVNGRFWSVSLADYTGLTKHLTRVDIKFELLQLPFQRNLYHPHSEPSPPAATLELSKTAAP